MSLLNLEYLDNIALLILNRPESLNALGATDDGKDMALACDEINANPKVRCVVITGAGRAFSSGGDIKAMKAREGAFAGSAYDIRNNYRQNIHRIVRAIYGLEVPTIAAVNGAAIGLGCDLACMCDIRIASEKAKFAVSFLKLGLIPGDGGAWLLPRIIGHDRAAQLLFTGETIDAETALNWRLVTQVVPQDKLREASMDLARRIAVQPPHALRLAKHLMRQGVSMTYDSLMEMSATAQAISHLTQDHEEGLDALLQGRQPVFQGS